MVVSLVALPNGPHQSALRPSSTAIVPSGAAQRCKVGSAPALAAPPAAPVTPAFWPPGVTIPPHAASEAVSTATPANLKIVFILLLIPLSRYAAYASCDSISPPGKACGPPEPP
jgi:hypothetical protein